MEKQRGNANGYGFGVKVNMRWYFEHVLQCVPITYASRQEEHKTFLTEASLTHGGLHTLYRRWGVTVAFGIDMLMPLVMQLAYLTGLNPGPLLALDIDCYGEKHPATNSPYLRFVKSKTSSQHELHLNLLDADEKDEEAPLVNNEKMFAQELRYLPRKQAHQIAKTIGMILSATALLREELPAESPHKRRLLIYRATSNFSDGQVCGLSPAASSQWCRLVVKKYNLVGDDGGPLKLNLVRFRSSKLTELARQGRDLLEIRLIGNHKNVRTTMAYLSRRNLDVTANRVLRNALEQIHANREEFGTESCARPSDEKPIQIFRGIVSDCKNVFDPPKKVRLARSYQAGKACSRFNMCLFCKNIIIFREHLPLLIAYLGQINVSLENNVQNVPNPRLYEDSKAMKLLSVKAWWKRFDGSRSSIARHLICSPFEAAPPGRQSRQRLFPLFGPCWSSSPSLMKFDWKHLKNSALPRTTRRLVRLRTSTLRRLNSLWNALPMLMARYFERDCAFFARS